MSDAGLPLVVTLAPSAGTIVINMQECGGMVLLEKGGYNFVWWTLAYVRAACGNGFSLLLEVGGYNFV